MLLVYRIVYFVQVSNILCSFTKLLPSLNFTVDGDGRQIFVFDNILQPNVGRAFKIFLDINKYSYLYPDPYENRNSKNEGNLYWKSPINPSTLIKTRFWKYIRDAYKSLPEKMTKGQKYLPYEAYGTILHRGDTPVAFKGDEKEDADDEIFVRVFLTSGLGKHAYSEQSFYDQDGEIVASIYPKVNRILLWTGNIETLFHPPSMGFRNYEYSFFMKLTNNMKLFQKSSTQFNVQKEKEDAFKEQPFPFTNTINTFDFSTINISDKVLGKYQDRNGDVIAFFDNIFPQELLSTLRTYFLSYTNLFSANNYDTSLQETNDNVNWIASFHPEKIVNTPYMALIQKLAEYLSNSTGWHPYDVSCNLIQHTHHTRIHIDCNNNEYEYTFLLYLNPNWNENMYAETSFYQYDVETMKLINKIGFGQVDGEGLENYDFLAAVIPKFGRVALFRNLIPHSARPPAPSFLAARYTFPVKISKSMPLARAKVLREISEEFDETMDDDFQSLKEGEYGPFLSEGKREYVEKNIQKLRERHEENRKKHLGTIVNFLFPGSLKPTTTV